MAKETATAGTIGQMYQNRKKPEEIGVLESRDEKYKTLLFRDREGKTFNIAYSSFRSSWRKYEGDEVIETSTQKEQKAAKKEEKTEQAKENLKEPKKTGRHNDDKRKPDLTEEELAKLQEDGAAVLKDIVEKNDYGIYTVEQKFIKKSSQIRTQIFAGEDEVVEIWVCKTKPTIGLMGYHTTDEVFKNTVFRKEVGEITAKKSTSPKEKRPISFKLPTDIVEIAVADILKSVAPIFADKLEQEKEEKEKK